MDIELKQITVRDVANGYVDSAENGVVGYGGRLNIRPAFQRESLTAVMNCLTDNREQSAFVNTSTVISPSTTDFSII